MAVANECERWKTHLGVSAFDPKPVRKNLKSKPRGASSLLQGLSAAASVHRTLPRKATGLRLGSPKTWQKVAGGLGLPSDQSRSLDLDVSWNTILSQLGFSQLGSPFSDPLLKAFCLSLKG